MPFHQNKLIACLCSVLIAGSLCLAVNGAEIKPAYMGPPLVATTQRRKLIVPRDDGICDGDWVPVPGKEDYTRPADGAQVLSGLYTGPVDITMTTTRTQSWSTTIETSLGFEDMISLGFSFSGEFSESLSDSDLANFFIPDGEAGYVAWTSYVRCTEGSGTCDGEEVSGEVCTPYLDRNSQMLAGVYSIVQRSGLWTEPARDVTREAFLTG